jgi:hypothetical protein
MHFRCERYCAATTPHENKPNQRSQPNKHCLALPVSARTSGRCRAQASGRCAGMQVYPRQGVAVRTGAAMPLLHLAAGGMGGVSGKAPPTLAAKRPQQDKTYTGTTMLQKAKGRRNISPVLLPLDEEDGH